MHPVYNNNCYVYWSSFSCGTFASLLQTLEWFFWRTLKFLLLWALSLNLYYLNGVISQLIYFEQRVRLGHLKSWGSFQPAFFCEPSLQKYTRSTNILVANILVASRGTYLWQFWSCAYWAFPRHRNLLQTGIYSNLTFISIFCLLFSHALFNISAQLPFETWFIAVSTVSSCDLVRPVWLFFILLPTFRFCFRS